MWHVEKRIVNGQRRLAVMSGTYVVFLLWPHQRKEAETMCDWRNDVIWRVARGLRVA